MASLLGGFMDFVQSFRKNFAAKSAKNAKQGGNIWARRATIWPAPYVVGKLYAQDFLETFFALLALFAVKSLICFETQSASDFA